MFLNDVFQYRGKGEAFAHQDARLTDRLSPRMLRPYRKF